MTRTEIPTTCPYCGQPLVRADAIQRLRRVQRQLDRERAEWQRRIRAQIEADARRRLEDQVERRVRAIRAQEAKRTERLTSTVVALRAQLAELRRERLELTRAHHAELTELRRSLDAQKRKELAAERKRLEASLRAQLERSAHAKVQREYQGQLTTLHRITDSLRRENERLQRQLEQVGAADRGDLNEDKIVQELQLTFRDDEIVRQKRGRAGTDILHRVQHRVGGELQEAGLIIYECKDTQRWSNNFVAQAKRSAKTHGTPYVVLASRAFPRGRREVLVQEGVIIVHPNHVVQMAHVVRSMVVGIHQAQLSGEGRARKTAAILRYLSSAAFRQTFGLVSEHTRKLRELLEDEREAHRRVWAKREQAYQEIREAAGTIESNIRGIIEQAAPARRARVIELPSRTSSSG